MFRKAALFLIVIALASLSAVGMGCTSEKWTPGIDLVPHQADIVADVNLFRIFSDPDVLDLVNEIGANLEEPKTFDELLDQLEDETGIDLRDFSKIVIFGDTEFEDYVGAIVKGDFDQEALIDTVESQFGEEMTSTSYKGYTLYLMANEDEETAICLLDDNSIAFGTAVTVKDAIDVKEGASPVGEPVSNTYTALGEAWAKVAMETPTEEVEEITEGVLPGLTVLQDIESIGISFSKIGANLSFQLKLLCSGSAAAEDVEATLSAIPDLLAFVPDLPDEVVELVDRLKVTQTDSWVTVSFEATKTEIRAWAQDLGPAFGDIWSME